MALTMYDASVTVFLHNLKQLSHLLDKAEAHAKEKGVEPATLFNARLADDMLPFVTQVQIACDSSKLALGRLTGLEMPRYADDETTFEQLRARIAKTRDLLKSAPRDAFQGSEEREVKFKAGPVDVEFTGQSYLLHFALPNFFFHVTTAYAILRHNGIEIGKPDFIHQVITA